MTFQIADERDESRYAAYVDGRPIGYAEWILVHKTILLPYLEVEPDYHDKGIGSMLLHRILGDAREEGHTLLPLCPFAHRWTELHPEYDGIARAPLPGELAAVQAALATARERRRAWGLSTEPSPRPEPAWPAPRKTPSQLR